ncbi:glycosyltransferase [Planctomycetota bacterium]|nr:glycosyltransferase [Planctomycetota bacterium]
MNQLNKLKIYQAKTAIFLPWSQPFIYRLLDKLKPHIDQIVLTRFHENGDIFPMPIIELCNKKTFFDPIAAQKKAQQLQAKHQGKLIHAHFGYTAINMMFLKIFLRVPMIVTFGGKDLSVFAQRPEAHSPFIQLFDLCEKFVAVSDSLKQQAIDLGCPEDKIVTIRRGVPTDQFPYKQRSTSTDKPCNILMVSRLTKKKGHLFALKALNKLTHLDWQLHLVGEGEEYAPIIRFAKKNGFASRLHFHGVLPIEKVYEQMQKADILLHPSITGKDGDQEGIPNALVEAMSTGLPIVGTHHGGIPEVVIHNQTGFLVQENDQKHLIYALQTLIENPTQRLALGKAASNYVAQHLSLDDQVSKYLDLYQSLIEQYPPHTRNCAGTNLSPELPMQLATIHRSALTSGDFSIAEVLESALLAPAKSDVKHPLWFRLYWRIKKIIPFRVKFAIKRMLFRFFVPFVRKDVFREQSIPFWHEICANNLDGVSAPDTSSSLDPVHHQ